MATVKAEHTDFWADSGESQLLNFWKWLPISIDRSLQVCCLQVLPFAIFSGNLAGHIAVANVLILKLRDSVPLQSWLHMTTRLQSFMRSNFLTCSFVFFPCFCQEMLSMLTPPSPLHQLTSLGTLGTWYCSICSRVAAFLEIFRRCLRFAESCSAIRSRQSALQHSGLWCIQFMQQLRTP